VNERDHLENQGVDARIMLKWKRKGVDLIDLALNIFLGRHKMQKIFFTS
jgi:hypothetical protein